ncbi:MAG: hypothetical protein J6A04_01460 [Clostridia bacterium]|nr:hypothetical protein [Clostridia bacterium]
MKPTINATLSYSKGDILIRMMSKSDVSNYAFHMGRTQEERNQIRTQMKKRIENRKDDDIDLIFTVLYGGKFFGCIQTKAVDRYGTEANVEFFLPQNKEFEELNTQTVRNFIEMCRETRVYDEKLNIIVFENGKMSAYVISMNKSSEKD